jgi:hypothetical protein
MAAPLLLDLLWPLFLLTGLETVRTLVGLLIIFYFASVFRASSSQPEGSGHRRSFELALRAMGLVDRPKLGAEIPPEIVCRLIDAH